MAAMVGGGANPTTGAGATATAAAAVVVTGDTSDDPGGWRATAASETALAMLILKTGEAVTAAAMVWPCRLT